MSEIIKKRRQLTVSEKLTLIDKIDGGKKLTAVAREFGISTSTASGIMKEKSKIKHIRDYFNLAPHRKRVRLGSYFDVDEAVYLWFRQMRAKNKPVNGPMLQQKAREFASKLGRKNFEGSSGWLFRFRERHDMSVESMRGDNRDCAMTSIGMTDEEIVSSLSQNLATQSEYIVSNVDLSDISYDDSGTELPTYNTDLEEKPTISNDISLNENKNYCDSTDEIVGSCLRTEKSSLKLSEAISLMKNLTCFFEQQKDIPKDIWDSLNNVNNFMLGDLAERFTQRKITEYFK